MEMKKEIMKELGFKKLAISGIDFTATKRAAWVTERIARSEFYEIYISEDKITVYGEHLITKREIEEFERVTGLEYVEVKEVVAKAGKVAEWVNGEAPAKDEAEENDRIKELEHLIETTRKHKKELEDKLAAARQLLPRQDFSETLQEIAMYEKAIAAHKRMLNATIQKQKKSKRKQRNIHDGGFYIADEPQPVTDPESGRELENIVVEDLNSGVWYLATYEPETGKILDMLDIDA